MNAAERPGARMAEYTTFRLGGPCRRLFDCPTADSVAAAVRAVRAAGEPFRLIGGGSNLLVADAGLPAAVVRFVTPAPEILREDGRLVVSAGTALDDLAAFAARAGLGGLTFATGIPGTVGGAVAGNAGAFGEQIADRLVSLTLLEPDGAVREAPRDALRFSYRDSELKGSDRIILRATLSLPSADPETLRAERTRLLEWRRTMHPDWTRIPCAGSFFRNLEPTSAAERRQAAGWFLEQAGALALRVGGAAVYAKHANIPIKAADDCTAGDVRELTRRMAEAVRARFGIVLVPEVQYWD